MIDFVDCETSYDEIGRIYHTPHGKFYSVTTMLGASGDKSFLDDWRERTGGEAADKITRQAGQLGSDYHELGENFLLRKPLPEVQWLAKLLFDKTIPVLKKNISNVHAAEIPLWSKVLQIAGRTDAIVDWRGELAIFDFKCIGHHNPEWLADYWVQTSIYAYCLKEMFGLDAKKLVLVVANKKNLTCKSFISETHKYNKKAVERIKEFRKILDSHLS